VVVRLVCWELDVVAIMTLNLQPAPGSPQAPDSASSSSAAASASLASLSLAPSNDHDHDHDAAIASTPAMPPPKPTPRAKVPLEKGYSQMVWLRLLQTEPDLAGQPPSPPAFQPHPRFRIPLGFCPVLEFADGSRSQFSLFRMLQG
jgi:hypothetical protein